VVYPTRWRSAMSPIVRLAAVRDMHVLFSFLDLASMTRTTRFALNGMFVTSVCGQLPNFPMLIGTVGDWAAHVGSNILARLRSPEAIPPLTGYFSDQSALLHPANVALDRSSTNAGQCLSHRG